MNRDGYGIGNCIGYYFCVCLWCVFDYDCDIFVAVFMDDLVYDGIFVESLVLCIGCGDGCADGRNYGKNGIKCVNYPPYLW